MVQYTFRVKSSTNCKTTLLIKAKDYESALKKLDDMGFSVIEFMVDDVIIPTKTTWISKEYWDNKNAELDNEMQLSANAVIGQAMLDNPEDYDLV